jgi:hypothetical protein
LTSASLIPYRYGWCRLHIDGVQAATWEVGTVPGGEYDANGRAVIKTGADGKPILIPRVITDEDISTLAVKVIAALQRYEAQEVRFEWPGRRTVHAERIGAALEAALAEAGIATERRGRRQRERPAQEAATETASGADSIPADPSGSVVASCADVVASEPVRQTSDTEATDAPSGGNAAPGEVDPAGSTTETFQPGTAETSPEVPAVAFTGPCFLGVDPGSRAIGVAVLDSAGRLVHRQTIEVGQLVPLATPVRQHTGDGEIRERTTRRVITQGDVGQAVADVVGLATDLQGSRVAIEWILDVRLPALTDLTAEGIQRWANAARSIATATARAQWLGGAVHGALLVAGLDVEVTVARTWQAAVTGAKAVKGRRGLVADVVEGRWPELVGGDEHQRDAAGLVAWLTMPVAVAQEKKTAKGERTRGRRREPGAHHHQSESEKRKQKRVGAGCACASRRHRRECPLYVPVKYKKKTTMKEAANG